MVPVTEIIGVIMLESCSAYTGASWEALKNRLGDLESVQATACLKGNYSRRTLLAGDVWVSLDRASAWKEHLALLLSRPPAWFLLFSLLPSAWTNYLMPASILEK